MTNAVIVLNESIKLMEEGILKATGNMIRVQDEAGNEIEIMEPETIHTYNGWKERGYQVQKGQKAVAKFPIWNYSKSKKEDEEEKGRMYLKLASWFTLEQVAAIAK